MTGIALLNNAFIRIKGADAAKFLNGLMTTRLSPSLVKKKEHTISPISRKHLNLESVDMLKNWGVMFEDLSSDTIRILRSGVFSMFLNSKGRVVSDCFNYPYPFHTTTPNLLEACERSPNYLVEVAERDVSKIFSLLRLHKLSAKVTIEKTPELYSYYHYDESGRSFLEQIGKKYFQTETPDTALVNANALIESGKIFARSEAKNIVALAMDNRIRDYGIKIVTSKKYEIPGVLFSKSFSSQFNTDPTTEGDIVRRRFQDGLFETADAPAGQSLLPFETGVDFNTGISLNKGCYVGQELTIRTYNLGVIRKRIVPITFDEDVSHQLASVDLLEVVVERDLQTGDSKPRRGKLGKLLSVNGKLGFLLTAYEDICTNDQYVAIIDGVKVAFTARIPEHWN